MARPSTYPLELRERAARLALESREACPSEFEAFGRSPAGWGSDLIPSS